jgi:hypothetical protein
MTMPKIKVRFMCKMTIGKMTTGSMTIGKMAMTKIKIRQERI